MDGEDEDGGREDESGEWVGVSIGCITRQAPGNCKGARTSLDISNSPPRLIWTSHECKGETRRRANGLNMAPRPKNDKKLVPSPRHPHRTTESPETEAAQTGIRRVHFLLVYIYPLINHILILLACSKKVSNSQRVTKSKAILTQCIEEQTRIHHILPEQI